MGETGSKRTTTLSNETQDCGQTLHQRLFNDCCVIHGEFNDCDENGKRICQCKRKELIAIGKSGNPCRLSGKSNAAMQPHQDAQEVIDALNYAAQQDEEANTRYNPETLETRNTVGSPKSETKASSVGHVTVMCSDVHHDICTLQNGGTCDHPHHNECAAGKTRMAPGTRAGTEDGTASQTVKAQSVSLVPESILNDSMEINSSPVDFDKTTAPSLGSSNTMKEITSHTADVLATAGKSDYRTSTADPRKSSGESIQKPFQQADESKIVGVDLTATKDRPNTSFTGPNTADALQASLGGRQSEKGMRVPP